MLTHSVGTPVTLGVERDGRPQDIVVTPQDGRGVYAGQTELAPTSDKHASGVHRHLRGVGPGAGQSAARPGDAGVALGQATTGEVSAVVHVFSPSGVSSVYHQVTNSKAPTEAADHPTTSERPVVHHRVGDLGVQALRQASSRCWPS